MNSESIEFRVNRIKKKIESYAQDPEHDFIIEPVSHQALNLLRSKEDFPPDMLLILEDIGCMQSWSLNGHIMLDWWIPSNIELSYSENRCFYDVFESFFTNPSGLLFFAFDCDATLYFYDISVSPWKVVVCDALNAADSNRYSGTCTPWVETSLPDALAVIERWVFRW
jgi:hypothetical protein